MIPRADHDMDPGLPTCPRNEFGYRIINTDAIKANKNGLLKKVIMLKKKGNIKKKRSYMVLQNEHRQTLNFPDSMVYQAFPGF